MYCCARRLVKAAPTDSSLKLARLASSNSDAIRAHFVELTTAVLLPFAPYCEALGPPEDGSFDSEQHPPHLTPFSHAEFMDQLQASALAPPLQRCFRSQASMCFNDHPALLCCAFLLYAVLSYDVSCHAVLCCTVLCKSQRAHVPCLASCCLCAAWLAYFHRPQQMGQKVVRASCLCSYSSLKALWQLYWPVTCCRTHSVVLH